MAGESSEDENEEYNTIVIDNGSGSIKAGYGNSDTPRSVFPTVIGHPRQANTHSACKSDDYIGDEAVSKRELLDLRYPIQQGCVNNWDDMEKVRSFQIELQQQRQRLPREQHAADAMKFRSLITCQLVFLFFCIQLYF